jgi:hypothetical protein
VHVPTVTAIASAAAHVADDTGRDENWHANTPDNADRLRFYPCPPRRLRSPRPIFGLDQGVAVNECGNE